MNMFRNSLIIDFRVVVGGGWWGGGGGGLANVDKLKRIEKAYQKTHEPQFTKWYGHIAGVLPINQIEIPWIVQREKSNAVKVLIMWFAWLSCHKILTDRPALVQYLVCYRYPRYTLNHVIIYYDQ